MNEHEKIKLLRRLVKEYLPYVNKWKSVEVTHDRFEGIVYITWYSILRKKEGDGTMKKIRNFTRREIGVSDLDERIKSYRNKISYAKKSKV